ncbi:hypothetical protein HOF65_05620 [bacterium]|nr:hypothetical protein [bacterium]
MKANIKENNNRFLDLYTSDVTTANSVLNIRNKNVVHTVKILFTSSHNKYLHESITR